MKKALILCFFLFSCSQEDQVKEKNIKVDYILRNDNTLFCPLYKPKFKRRDIYPWEEGKVSNICKITKEFFRCKGSSSNHPVQRKKTYNDCNSKHGLPLFLKKEGVYPILIELLNYIQYQTKKSVIITWGHRCPIHNAYSDGSKLNTISKHMIGAEVDFFVKGMEYKTTEIIELIFSFYREKKKYLGKEGYKNFSRYNKNTNVSTKPWFNKEIFLKLFLEKEGRDFDNKHPYPYISIAVRYDIDEKKNVMYSWKKANEYLR